MAEDQQNAIVTTTAPDGTVETQECLPDSYVIVTGPQRYVAAEQVYPKSGTAIITIKRMEPDDG